MAVALSNIESFADISEAAITALNAAAELHHLKGGEYLVRQGEQADTLYLVATGRFEMQMGDGRIVAQIDGGEPVGELAFFAGGTRTADVRASRDASVLALSRTAYAKIAEQHPDVVESILAFVSKRLAATTGSSRALPAKPGKVIALLPAGKSPLPDGLAEKVTAALGQYDHAQLVRQEDKPDSVDPTTTEFGQWLGELEQSNKRVILRAGNDEGWNRAIARNADDFLLVAPLNETDCNLSALEEFALPLSSRSNRMVILWRKHSAEPITRSSEWLSQRPAKLHHHLALDNSADFDRIGRFMAGRANGIVLAGGGALGCAHLGVMEALIESGVPIDFYGGTSAGAAMAGALARGLTAQETLEQMQDMFITHKAMKKMTIPVHSLLDPHIFDEQLEERYSATDLTDLPFNYFAVSTNLSTNSVYVHRDGPLWEAVRASGSLPTILPPFITDKGDILVDGGVLDNVPVEIMRELKAGPNVVVTLRTDAGVDWRIKASYDDVRSPSELLVDLVLRRKPEHPFPSLIEIMSRSMVVASEGAVRDNLSQADVLLTPPIPDDMQILDWHLGKDVAEAARKFTIERIESNPDLAAMKA